MQDNTKRRLTKLEAFKAMEDFLIKHYARTSSDDIGSLLGDMRILEDGSTADTAAWEYWTENIERIIKKTKRRDKIEDHEKEHFTNVEAFKMVQDYLEGYVERTSSEDITVIIEDMQLVDEPTSNSIIWKDWCASINNVCKNER